MRISIIKILASLVIVFILNSCKQSEVEGIIIGHTLSENQSLEDNQKLQKLIRKTLRGDAESLVTLLHFECGGGAGCYDLGSIVTQIIYKRGENNFIEITNKLDAKSFITLESLVSVGLEYGDNNIDGKMEYKKIETEFPQLFHLIKIKK